MFNITCKVHTRLQRNKRATANTFTNIKYRIRPIFQTDIENNIITQSETERLISHISNTE